MESMELGAYWGDRPEGLDSAARRLHGFLQDIGAADPLLKLWVSRRRSAGLRLDTDATVADVRDLLGYGVKRTDFTSDLLTDLGFSFGLWNGHSSDDEASALMGTCGLAAGNPHLSNAVSLSIPLRSAARAADLLDGAVRRWEPDWAWIGTDVLRDAQQAGLPLLGRHTYVTGAHATRLRQVFPGVDVHRGYLITVDDLTQVPGLVPRFRRALTAW